MYHNKIEVSWSRYKALITEVQSSRTWSSLGQAEDAKMIWSVKKLGAPPATAILQILHSLLLPLSSLLCSPLIFPAVAGADVRQTP
jgi:hypothetical protein